MVSGDRGFADIGIIAGRPLVGLPSTVEAGIYLPVTSSSIPASLNQRV